MLREFLLRQPAQRDVADQALDPRRAVEHQVQAELDPQVAPVARGHQQRHLLQQPVALQREGQAPVLVALDAHHAPQRDALRVLGPSQAQHVGQRLVDAQQPPVAVGLEDALGRVLEEAAVTLLAAAQALGEVAQLGAHRIELVGQVADLVGMLGLDLGAELAAGHPLRQAAQARDRPLHQAAHQHVAGQRDRHQHRGQQAGHQPAGLAQRLVDVAAGVDQRRAAERPGRALGAGAMAQLELQRQRPHRRRLARALQRLQARRGQRDRLDLGIGHHRVQQLGQRRAVQVPDRLGEAARHQLRHALLALGQRLVEFVLVAVDPVQADQAHQHRRAQAQRGDQPRLDAQRRSAHDRMPSPDSHVVCGRVSRKCGRPPGEQARTGPQDFTGCDSRRGERGRTGPPRRLARGGAVRPPARTAARAALRSSARAARPAGAGRR